MSNLLFTNGKACLNYLYNYRNEEVMKCSKTVDRNLLKMFNVGSY